jgi:hypothetical protein
MIDSLALAQGALVEEGRGSEILHALNKDQDGGAT